jgi:hypothetical protein
VLLLRNECRSDIDLLLECTFCSVEIVLTKTKLNSVAFSPQANYTDERPPHVGEVSAKFCGQRVSRGQRNGSLRPLISVF